jgi:hypothetical protein
MGDNIDKLFGGPDAPNPEAQTPTEDVVDVGPDEFPDGFASDPRSADADELGEPLEGTVEDKVETYNEEFEDASDRNDRVTEDMLAAVSVRAMGAFEESSLPEANLMEWTLGRQNEFLERAANLDEDAGFEVSDAYRQDDDLLPRGFEASTLEDDEVNPGNGPDLR